MALSVLADRDGFLLVEVLLLMKAPMIGVNLVHLASTVFQVISTQPFTKTEDFLEGLLELCGILVVGLQAAKQIINMYSKHSNQFWFGSFSMSSMWILIIRQEQTCIQGVLNDCPLARA